jgi:6-phosphofructokinase 1
MENSDLDFTIERLGECRFSFPQQGGRFTDDGERILYDTQVDVIRRMFREGKEPPSMEVAGPREKIFFDPSSLACGIVTCGGLC